MEIVQAIVCTDPGVICFINCNAFAGKAVILLVGEEGYLPPKTYLGS